MYGFKMQESRLNRPQAAAVDSSAGTTFTGLATSKPVLLRESKLTPSTGAIHAKTAGGAEGKEEVPATALPTTFRFIPLSILKEDKSDGTKEKEKEAKTVFGEAASSPHFSNAASKASDGESEKKTLSESVAEYIESHANKRKYDVVDVVTGEEAESNVLGSQVKLFIFDKDKRNWIEKGEGMMRLNDAPVSTPGPLFSRLVMRTSGNMRVVLNTKLWLDMICEKASEKNVRISALDEGKVKLFLIAFRSLPAANELFTAVKDRIKNLQAGGRDDEDKEEKKQEQEQGKRKRQREEEEDEDEEPKEKRPATTTVA